MLRPSYSELMQILNDDHDLDNKITSRYAIVIATAKRARMLINGAEAKATADTNKAVSVAVMEMRDGLLSIIPNASNMYDAANADDDSIDYLSGDDYDFTDPDDGFKEELKMLVEKYNSDSPQDEFEENTEDEEEEE